MRFVVDASVAVKWIVPEEHEAAAEAVLGEDVERIAPEFLLVETANVLRTKLSRGQIDAQQARGGLGLVTAAISTFVADRELAGRAFEIAADMGHSVYDCLYLACAERADAHVITADRRLAERAATTSFQERVQVLST